MLTTMTGTNYHQLLVTLFGPRNETVLGQMNLTPITMPHVALDGGAGPPVASDDPATAAAGGLGGDGTAASKSSAYDSRGAAYYVCVVIVVYVFAIVSFVLSVARRRRGGGRHDDDKYRLPSDDVIDDRKRRRRRRRTGVCWSRVRGAEDIVGWTQWSSTSEEGSSSPPPHTPNGVTVVKEDCAAADDDAATDNHRETVEVDFQRDEFITLVQVLPFCGEAENCAVAVDSRERSARVERDFADRDVGLNRENGPRCCWSMGPDGNIWIIQVHEDDFRRDSPAQTGDKTTNQSMSRFYVNLNNDDGLRPPQTDRLIALTLSLQSSALRGSEFDRQRRRPGGEPPSDEDRQPRKPGDTVEDGATTVTHPTNIARETIVTYMHSGAPLANVHATTPEQPRVPIRNENPNDSDDYTLVFMPKITSPGFVPRLIHVTSV